MKRLITREEFFGIFKQFLPDNKFKNSTEDRVFNTV